MPLRGLPAILVILLLIGCESPSQRPRLRLIEKGPYQALYGQDGRLQRLVYDKNGDGTAEVVTHFARTGKPEKAEIDTDGDAVVDRWEYFLADGTLEKVGLSRRKNGTPDEWDYPNAAGGLARREFDDDGDGRIDREERAGGR